MLCSRCDIDMPDDQFGPSAVMWPTRRVCRPCGRQLSQRKRHGVTRDDRDEIATAQGGCAICGHAEPGAKGWVVDHDHACCDGDSSCPKCRRGVLCQWCNSMLGYAFDRVETLRAAIAYLDAPRTCAWHVPIACAPGICDALIHGENGENGLTENLAEVDKSLTTSTRARSTSDSSMGGRP